MVICSTRIFFVIAMINVGVIQLNAPTISRYRLDVTVSADVVINVVVFVYIYIPRSHPGYGISTYMKGGFCMVNEGHTWILWVSQTEHFYMILREIVDNQSYMPTLHIWLTYKSFVVHFWYSKSGYQNIIVYSFLFISIDPPKPLPLSPHTGLSHAQHKAARVKSFGPFCFQRELRPRKIRICLKMKMVWGYPRPTNSGVREGFFGGPGHENEGTITISLASWVDYTPKIYIYIYVYIIHGSLYYQPKQCIVIRKIPQKYHRFVLFDSPMSDGW